MLPGLRRRTHDWPGPRSSPDPDLAVSPLEDEKTDEEESCLFRVQRTHLGHIRTLTGLLICPWHYGTMPISIPRARKREKRKRGGGMKLEEM